jgi:hypothetical protein
MKFPTVMGHSRTAFWATGREAGPGGKGVDMSYEEKLGTIDEEIEAMEQDDYPEDIIEKLRTEALGEQREFLMERLEEQLDDYDWWEYGEEAATDLLRERMIAERLTPKEKAEYEADQNAQAVKSAKASLEQALKAQADNQRDIDTATRLGKQGMLRHHTELQRKRQQDVEACQRHLAESLLRAGTQEQE